MTNIEFVYFDLDDTLLDHKYAEKRALQELVANQSKLFNHTSFEKVVELYSVINPDVWHKYSAGVYSKDEAKIGRFQQLLEACDSTAVHQAPVLAEEYLDRYSRHWIAIKGALEAFIMTAAKLPVGILTNGFSEVQKAKLRQFPELGDRAQTVIISEEVGHLKPSQILFDHAAERAGIKPEKILYVGDSFRSDVEGGTGAGWKVAWYSEQKSDLPGVWSFTNWEEFGRQLNSQS